MFLPSASVLDKKKKSTIFIAFFIIPVRRDSIDRSRQTTISPTCPQISVMCLQKHRMVKQPINNLHQENHKTNIWNQPSQDYEMQFHQITFNIPTSCRSTIFLLICYQCHSQDIFCGTYQRVYQQRWVTCHITHYTRYSWHCIGSTKDSILLHYGQV